MRRVFALSVSGLALGSIGYLGTVIGPSARLASQPSHAIHPSIPLLPVPKPCEISSVDQLVGAYTYVNVGAGMFARAQIHEYRWGITSDNYIGLAVFKAVLDNGESVEYDHPERYVRLVDSPEGLDDSYFVYPGRIRVGVERIGYRIDESGYLQVSVWIGRDKDGRAFVYDNVAGTLAFDDDPPGNGGKPPVTCCHSDTGTQCISIDGCTAGCQGPTNCACTSPAGSSCMFSNGPWCLGACGGTICHSGTTCGGTPPNCACH